MCDSHSVIVVWQMKGIFYEEKKYFGRSFVSFLRRPPVDLPGICLEIGNASFVNTLNVCTQREKSRKFRKFLLCLFLVSDLVSFLLVFIHVCL